MGQRPYSRREIARIVAVAQDRANDRGTKRWSEKTLIVVSSILARMRDRFGPRDDQSQDVSVELLDAAGVSLNSTDAQRRLVSTSNRQNIETTIDPLARRRLGSVAPMGRLASLEVAHRIDVADWLAVQGSERVEVRAPDDPAVAATTGEVLTLLARARIRNLALTVGRSPYAWSQAPGSGLFLASDAPALDAVSVASDAPSVMPGFLRYLGGVKGTLIVADLGASVHRSHSKLLTYKVSVQPTAAFELGATFMNHFGGTGARPSSTVDRIIDFLPFIDVFRKHNYVDSTRPLDVDSDKLLGIDGRFRVRSLGGMTIRGEMLIDDFDVHRLQSLLTTTASQYVDVVFPHVGDDALSLRVVAKHMGILTYSHNQLQDGITTRGRLLGDELGPDSKSFAGIFEWTPSESRILSAELHRSIYSSAMYTQYYSDPGMTISELNKLSSLPNETRTRFMLGAILKPDAFWTVSARAGIEQTENFNWAGGTRHDYVAEVSLRMAQ
jgi:hypothetical protein